MVFLPSELFSLESVAQVPSTRLSSAERGGSSLICGIVRRLPAPSNRRPCRRAAPEWRYVSSPSSALRRANVSARRVASEAVTQVCWCFAVRPAVKSIFTVPFRCHRLRRAAIRTRSCSETTAATEVEDRLPPATCSVSRWKFVLSNP